MGENIAWAKISTLSIVSDTDDRIFPSLLGHHKLDSEVHRISKKDTAFELQTAQVEFVLLVIHMHHQAKTQ